MRRQSSVLPKLAYSLLLASAVSLTVIDVMAESSYPGFQPDALSNDVTTNVVTPHIAWAKPYDGGPTRVLFVGPRFGQRETVEVMQRWFIQADTVLVGLVNQWDWGYPIYVPGSTKAELLDQLDKKLDTRHDVIAIGNIDWGLLPNSAVLKIFRHVASGGGLVVCQFGNQRLPKEYRQLLTSDINAPDFLSLVPLKQFLAMTGGDGRPILQATPVCECFAFRKGRVCLIDYPGAPNAGFHYLTADPNDALAYDYAQSFLIKSLLWASGKTSKRFQIRELSASPSQITVSGKGESTLTCSLVVKDRFGKTWHRDTMKTSATLRFDLPALPAETFFADVTVRDGDKVVDWGSTSFRVLGQETIQDIVLLNNVVYPDQPLKGRVATSRQLAEGEEIRVTLRDGWGRVFADLKLPDDKFADVLPVRSKMYVVFGSPVTDSLSTVNRVRAEWRSRDRVLAFAEKEFYVPRPKQGDFYTGVWSATERFDRWGWLATQLFSHERELGIDAGLIGHVYANPDKGIQNGIAMARAGMSPFPYVDRIAYYGTSRERVPCLSDPKWIEERGGQFRSWAFELRKAACIGYNLGDESNLSILGIDVCTAPPTLKVFREWLAKQYGTIESLNAEYGSSYKSFDEVFPLTRKEAETKGNLASWIDHKVFMARAMADYMGEMQGALRKSDPLARAGCEGIWGTAPEHGFEWTSQAEKAGVIIPYADEALAVEAVRSFVSPVSLTGLWSGGYPHIAMHEWKSRWTPWYALLHGMNSVWFYADYDGTTMNHPMLLLSQDFTLNRAGRWFIEETGLIKEGIGKLLLNAKRRNDPIALLYSQVSGYIDGNHADDVIAALEDAGYQYDMIARRDLEREGVLANYKALVLPRTVSLSDTEVKEIRRFIGTGGKVLTDVSPGEYDGHGKKREQPPLKEVPVLDFSLDHYEAARTEGKRRDVSAKVGALLEQAGLPKREAVPGLEHIVYEIPGGAIHAYLLRDTQQTQKAVTISTPVDSGKYVFDLIEAKALANPALKPGRPLLFAVLDQQPGQLTASVERIAGENRFTIVVQQKNCAFNVVHVDITDPKGNPANAYAENCLVKNGRLEMTRYLGINAASGTWTATLRDVLTGQKTSVKLDVESRKP